MNKLKFFRDILAVSSIASPYLINKLRKISSSWWSRKDNIIKRCLVKIYPAAKHGLDEPVILPDAFNEALANTSVRVKAASGGIERDKRMQQGSLRLTVPV